MVKVRKVKIYTDEEKRAIIEEYIISGETVKQIQEKYQIRGNSKITDWMNKFGIREKRIFASSKVRPMSDPSKTDKEKDLEKRIQQLEQELENERLRTKLLDKVIEIAERDLNVSILKKSGARQLKK